MNSTTSSWTPVVIDVVREWLSECFSLPSTQDCSLSLFIHYEPFDWAPSMLEMPNYIQYALKPVLLCCLYDFSLSEQSVTDKPEQ